MERYRRNSGAVYSLKYHVVFCPKYRRCLLVDDIALTLRALIEAKAEELGATVHACEIMPDHVHLFIESDPRYAVAFLVNQFKGYSARVLRETFPSLRTRFPAMWSRSYYAGTVGTVSESAVLRYIEQQRGS